MGPQPVLWKTEQPGNVVDEWFRHVDLGRKFVILFLLSKRNAFGSLAFSFDFAGWISVPSNVGGKGIILFTVLSDCISISCGGSSKADGMGKAKRRIER